VDGSQQRPELLGGEAGVAYDPTHRESVDWIMARDRDNSGTVSHYDVLALASDSKAGLFQGSHGCQVVDARYSRQR